MLCFAEVCGKCSKDGDEKYCDYTSINPLPVIDYGILKGEDIFEVLIR